MTSRSEFVRHFFGGGWATDLGPNADSVPRGGTVQFPFLVDAENVIYEFDGGPHKAPGTTKLNSSELESGAVIKGIFDFWISGTGGSSTQKRVIHIGTKIKKDDADGSFTDIFTGLTADAVPSYTALEDILVISNDGGDVPKSWDGTTAQNLAGSPPAFHFATTHQNRVWASGTPANPSRVSYSALLDPEDWTGAGSGSIDVEPDDGDRVTGLASYKNELLVFKGPYKGSIHRITGSAPTGDDAFARKVFIRGLGAVGHNTIFPFRDDLGFMWSDGSVRSLKTTAAFGDFTEAALSRPIHVYIREHVNFARLKHAWAADWPEFGFVLFALPVDGSSNNNDIFMMDYRFDPVRWSHWPDFSDLCGSLASVVDASQNNKRIIMAGGNDGFVRKLGAADRSIDGTTAISFKVTSPFMTYGTPITMKTIAEASLGLAPKNDGNVTFGYTLDNKAQRTTTFSQGGGDVLGVAAANQFTLGTSTLSGSLFVDRFTEIEDGGEFRAIQYQVTNAVNSEDVELHNISLGIDGGSWSTEN